MKKSRWIGDQESLIKKEKNGEKLKKKPIRLKTHKGQSKQKLGQQKEIFVT